MHKSRYFIVKTHDQSSGKGEIIGHELLDNVYIPDVTYNTSMPDHNPQKPIMEPLLHY
jgi:hypothetical protein